MAKLSYQEEKRGLINKEGVCYLLGISISGFYWLRRYVKTFPKPYVDNHIFGLKQKKSSVIKWMYRNCELLENGKF